MTSRNRSWSEGQKLFAGVWKPLLAAAFVDWSDHLKVKGGIQMAVLGVLQRCLCLVLLVLLSLGKPLVEVRRLDPVAVEEQQHGGQDHQEGKQQPHHQPHLTVVLDGAAVHASSEPRLLAKGRGPTTIAVTVAIAVAHPVAVAASDAGLQLGEGGFLAPAVSADLALATLGACHDEARVCQVPLAVLGAVDVCAATLHLDASCLDGGINGHRVGAFGLLGCALTLDLTTLGITFRTLCEVPILVFATVTKGVPTCVDIFKAGVMSWSGSVAPQLHALLLMGEAHAVVAVGDAVLAGRAVQQVDVGGTVRRRACAVFWQVTCSSWSTAHCARLLQFATLAAHSMCTLRLFFQSAIIGVAAVVGAFVRFSAVALLSVFNKTVATLLSSHQVLHVRHVVQTHPPSLLEVAVQVALTAAAEDAREGMTGRSSHHTASLLCGGFHAAAVVVVAHSKVVADLMGHGGSGSDGHV